MVTICHHFGGNVPPKKVVILPNSMIHWLNQVKSQCLDDFGWLNYTKQTLNKHKKASVINYSGWLTHVRATTSNHHKPPPSSPYVRHFSPPTFWQSPSPDVRRPAWLHWPLCQPGHLSSIGIPFMAASMWSPQPYPLGESMVRSMDPSAAWRLHSGKLTRL
jgi:hypothetical protein